MISLERQDLDALLQAGDTPVQFGFSCAGLMYQATYTNLGTHGELHMAAEIGALPYSGQSAVARTALLTIARNANEAVGKVFSLRGDSLFVDGRFNVGRSLNSLGILGEAVVRLLSLAPYLELMGMYLVFPALRQADEPALRPAWRRS